MTVTTDTTEKLAKKKTPPPLIAWAIRGGLAGLLVWISLWSLQGISALFHSPPPPVAEQPDFNPASALSLARFDSGAWQFLDSEESVSLETLPDSEAKRRWEQAPEHPGSQSLFPEKQSTHILELLKRSGTKKTHPGYRQYSLEYGGIHLAALIRDAEPSEIVSLRWLIPLGAGKSCLVTKPAAPGHSARTNLATSALEPVLPSRIPQQLLAVRSDDHGRTLCQSLNVSMSLVDLLDQLRKNSWKVDAPAHEVERGFVRIYITRETDAFWLLANPSPSSSSLRILLLRDDRPTPLGG